MIKNRFIVLVLTVLVFSGCTKMQKNELSGNLSSSAETINYNITSSLDDIEIIKFDTVKSPLSVSVEVKPLDSEKNSYIIYETNNKHELFSFNAYPYGNQKKLPEQLSNESFFVSRIDSDSFNKIVCIVDEEASCAYMIKSNALNHFFLKKEKLLIQCYANPLKIRLLDYQNNREKAIFEDADSKFNALYPQAFKNENNQILIEYGADTMNYVKVGISLSDNEIKILNYDLSDNIE